MAPTGIDDADSASLGEGLARAIRRPWKLGDASRLSIDAFAERFARGRGLTYEARGDTPQTTWLLGRMVPSKSHSFMRGPLAGGADGCLFYAERALHSSRGNLMEGWTVACYEIPGAGDLGQGLACVPRYPPVLGGKVAVTSAVPSGLTPVTTGDESFRERYEVGTVSAPDPEQLRLLFAPDFVAWMTSLATDKKADDVTWFELCGGTLCVANRSKLKTAQGLDAFCAAAARIAAQVR
jgi:hypothetical protein